MLSVDVLHVNQIPFLVSVSKNIHYGTIKALDSMKIPIMEDEIKCVNRMYEVRGFHVKYILVDIQFKAIKDRGQLTACVNVVAKGEHVPEIEHFNRVIKERTRCYYAMLPFKTLPRIMIIHLLVTVMFYINAFVWRKGVSQFLSPLTILEGIVIDYNLHFQVIFGEYAHTYETTTNTTKSRTVGAMALGPTGNLQGGVRFYSLVTGKILQRAKKDYTLLKMPEDAIRRINTMSKKSLVGLFFGDRNNIDLDNGDDITGVDNGIDDQINQEHPYDLRLDQQQEDDDDAPPLQDPTPLDEHLEAGNTTTDTNSDEDTQNTGVDVTGDARLTGVTPENAEDEIEPPQDDEIEHTQVDNDSDK